PRPSGGSATGVPCHRRYSGLALECRRDPVAVGQPDGGGDLQCIILASADRTHHRPERLSRVADCAAGRIAASRGGDPTRALARLRWTDGWRADVRLLTDR